MFEYFAAQVVIVALLDALWDVGLWGNNPEWVEEFFDACDAEREL